VKAVANSAQLRLRSRASKVVPSVRPFDATLYALLYATPYTGCVCLLKPSIASRYSDISLLQNVVYLDWAAGLEELSVSKTIAPIRLHYVIIMLNYLLHNIEYFSQPAS
jgi:hypothetical protein